MTTRVLGPLPLGRKRGITQPDSDSVIRNLIRAFGEPVTLEHDNSIIEGILHREYTTVYSDDDNDIVLQESTFAFPIARQGTLESGSFFTREDGTRWVVAEVTREYPPGWRTFIVKEVQVQ